MVATQNSSLATQSASLLAYLVWRDRRLHAGHFVLAQQQADAAVGAYAAGASVLLLCSADDARAILRAGQCDYVVNDVSEALRILKLSTRQAQPVLVALGGEVAIFQKELQQRGVVPDWEAKTPVVTNVPLVCDVATNPAFRHTQDASLQKENNAALAQWIVAAQQIFPRDLERWLPATTTP